MPEDTNSRAITHGIDAPLTRRAALRLFLGAGATTLLAAPLAALAEPQATQETTDALAAAQSQYDAAQAQIDQISQEYVTLAQQQDETMTQISQAEADIASTQTEIDAKQADLDKKQEVLSSRVASDYKAGPTNVLDVLLSSTSLSELSSNIYYMDKITSNDRDLIDEVKSAKAELDSKKAALEDHKSQLEDLSAQQTQQLTDMQAKQAEVQTVLDGLSQDVKDLMAQRDAEMLAAAAEAERKTNSYSGGTVDLPDVGGGQDYQNASAAQRRVVNACYAIGSPGAGLCATWVSQVFAAAGYGYYGGNACNMYTDWCHSSSKSDLQVGMIIAVFTHNHTSAGRTYGHIGIYIGDGMIMENIGYINAQSVDSWCSYYGTTVTPRWGWIGGVSLA